MRALFGLIFLFASSLSAQAQDRSLMSGRVVEAIYEAAGSDGALPMQHVSRELRAKVEAEGWPATDWLRGSIRARGDEGFRFPVLNVSGGSGDRPPFAAILVMHSADRAFARRFHMVLEDGAWRVRDVCLFPERQALTELIASDGASSGSSGSC